MKLIPHMYWITAAGVLAAIIWMINMLRFLLRKRYNALMIGFVGVFLAGLFAWAACSCWTCPMCSQANW